MPCLECVSQFNNHMESQRTCIPLGLSRGQHIVPMGAFQLEICNIIVMVAVMVASNGRK